MHMISYVCSYMVGVTYVCISFQVMQDSLGGNAKTLMIVNISPSECNLDETLTSLM